VAEKNRRLNIPHAKADKMKKERREATIFPKREYIYIRSKKWKKKIHHYIELNGEITNKKTFIKG